ncbi:MAG: hypothetical protein HY909_22830 [Deltaproteobacteria bacterium]|nr:hypothetical protein [Deltaproteobacteria bacterium]
MSLRATWFVVLVCSSGCASVVGADAGVPDATDGAAEVTDGNPPEDTPAVADAPDAAAVAGRTRCRELVCDNADQRCLRCPGAEPACIPQSGVLPCTREGALVAWCDGDEDCTGGRRCEWRMGDLFASMLCVPTNGRACNGFCGPGCASSCRSDEDCVRLGCGARCVAAVAGEAPPAGIGLCR